MPVSFDTIKMALTNSSILIFLDPNKPYMLYRDASKHDWSGVLTQERLTKVNDKDIVFFLPITYINGTSVGSQKN